MAGRDDLILRLREEDPRPGRWVLDGCEENVQEAGVLGRGGDSWDLVDGNQQVA